MAEKSTKETKKKKCFIITPIGDENTDIRRHTDGIIDECIEPVLGQDYELIVSHRISEAGSITKQIINGIHDSDIAIANLTGLNPNVMYELAFRHATKKPVIVIAEKSTIIPFDISDERMILYTNDIKGALELKKRLGDALHKVENISMDDVDNPIYNSLSSYEAEQIVMQEITGNDKNAFSYILKRLENIERGIHSARHQTEEVNKVQYRALIAGIKPEYKEAIENSLKNLGTMASMYGISALTDDRIEFTFCIDAKDYGKVSALLADIEFAYECSIILMKIS